MNIIVTGANTGIGLDLVKKYCDLKFNVLGFSRNIDNLKSLKNKYSNFSYISFDLSQGDYEKDLIPFIKRETGGRIDIMVNNAGYLVNKKFFDLSENDILKSFEINVFSIFKLTRLLYSYFQICSKIINISSLGRLPYTKKISGLSAYSSSKAAVSILTECLAEEFSKQGVYCNCFALGAVKTKMLKKAFPDFKGGKDVNYVSENIVKFSLSKDKLFTGKIINLADSF